MKDHTHHGAGDVLVWCEPASDHRRAEEGGLSRGTVTMTVTVTVIVIVKGSFNEPDIQISRNDTIRYDML
jgi:hypothetical protein